MDFYLTTSASIFPCFPINWMPIHGAYRPIYTIRLVAYDSYSGICDRVNMRKNARFQISPLANE